jgi:hypothetical protein
VCAVCICSLACNLHVLLWLVLDSLYHVPHEHVAKVNRVKSTVVGVDLAAYEATTGNLWDEKEKVVLPSSSCPPPTD